MWTSPRWYGLFVPGTLSRFDEIASKLVMRPSAATYFVRLDSKFDASVLARYGDRGLTPMVTLEPWLYGMRPNVMDPAFSLAALNTGSRDADLGRLADAFAQYAKPVYLRVAHEMNGHWYPWAVGQNGNTAADYLDFWKRVRSIFSVAPNIRWVWACASIQNLRISAPPIESLFPGDDFVDFVGTTGYGWDATADITYGKTFSRLAGMTNRDFIIPEMGAQQPVNKAGVTAVDWVHSFAAYLRANPRIRGFSWFHINPEIGATGDYRLDDTPTVDALNALLSEVPITSNTAMTDPQGSLLVTPRDVVNPTTTPYKSNVINGTYCSAKGPTRGYDKYGNLFECYLDPRGWNRWRRI